MLARAGAVGRRAWMAPLVAAIGLTLLVGSTNPVGADGPYEAKSLNIPTRRKDQVQPRVSGSWVVWKDYRNQDARAVDDSPNAEIYAWDLSSNNELRVGDTKNAGDPAISGTLVVWTAGDRNHTDIYGTDLQDGKVFTVSDAAGHQERPAISGTMVVWQDDRSGNWDIYARDVSGPKGDLPLVQQRDDQLHPAVSDRTVVWEDWRAHADGPDIWGYDLDSQHTYPVTGHHDAWEPAISGRWVVWVGKADQGVFARNLDDGPILRLSSAAGPKSQPSISGDLVVWTDERDGSRDIYGYDLANHAEFVVIGAEQTQDSPAIDGTTVVWSDGRGPNRDIGGAQLTAPAAGG